MPESFSDSKYKAWFKTLKLDINSRQTFQTVERNIVAMNNWWQNHLKLLNLPFTELLFVLAFPLARLSQAKNEKTS